MKQYFENTTENTIYVGGMAIGPGEGREVDMPEVRLPDAVEESDPDADLLDLLKGNVAAVKASLEGLGVDTLNRLTELESAAAKPRTGVLTALEDARLAIADAKLGSDDLNAVVITDEELAAILAGNVDAVKGSLDGLDVETLNRLTVLEQAADKPRKGVFDALYAAVLALKPAE